MEQKKTNKLLPILLAVLVVIACAVWYFNKPQGSAGTKTVTVEVYHGDGSEKTFTLETQAENLRGACEEQDLIQGTELDWFEQLSTGQLRQHFESCIYKKKREAFCLPFLFMDDTGFEPVAFRTSSGCSSQLS